MNERNKDMTMRTKEITIPGSRAMWILECGLLKALSHPRATSMDKEDYNKIWDFIMNKPEPDAIKFILRWER